jgi:hypothetical protein
MALLVALGHLGPGAPGARGAEGDDPPAGGPPRPPPVEFGPGEDPRFVVVKFEDGAEVSWRDGAFRDREGGALRLEDFEGRPYEVSRAFERSPDLYRAQREALWRKGVAGGPHQELFFSVRSPSPAATRALLEKLAAEPRIESARVPPAPAPSPTASGTPDLSPQQAYLGPYVQVPPPNPPPLGIRPFWDIPGGTGAGVTVLDIEYGWTLSHEDLPSVRLVGPTPDFPNGFSAAQARAETHHGTAALGIVAGQHNGFGIDGIAPDAVVLVAGSWTRDSDSFPQNVANAIDRAAAALAAGDVMLLEVQMPGPRWAGGTGQFGLLPAEWDDMVYAAIRAATASGIIVVEAAGNGSQDLDDPLYQGKFDRATRDSGALIVSHVVSAPPQPGVQPTTNFGRRIDLHFWDNPGPGTGYVTAGYGDLQDSADDRADYTGAFTASSACSATIAGGIASLQGIALRLFGAPLTVGEMGQVLARTGFPYGGVSSVAGVRPDFDGALRDLLSSRLGMNTSLAGATLNPSFEVLDRDWHRHRLAFPAAGGTHRASMAEVAHVYTQDAGTLFWQGAFVVPYGAQALAVDWELLAGHPDGAPCRERTARIWIERPDGESVTLADLDDCTPLLEPLASPSSPYTTGTGWRVSRSADLSAFAGEIGVLHVEAAALADRGAIAIHFDNVRFETLAAPSITAITPANGPICGGTEVVVRGEGLSAGDTLVRIGGAALLNQRFLDATAIAGETPEGASAGAADVEVSSSSGADTILDGFTYAAAACEPSFRRGDCNQDGDFDLSDAIFGLNALFTGGTAPACKKACDANDDGSHDISDASRFLGHLFLGGPRPPEPYPGCGSDTTEDALTCAAPTECA